MKARFSIAAIHALPSQYPLTSSLANSAAFVAGLGYFLATHFLDSVASTAGWLLGGFLFGVLFSAMILMAGTAFLTAGRTNSLAALWLEQYGDKAANAFAINGGRILGFIIGAMLAALIADAQQYWLLVLQVTLMALLSVCGPLICAIEARAAMTGFNKEGDPRGKAFTIRCIGMILVAMSAACLLQTIYKTALAVLNLFGIGI